MLRLFEHWRYEFNPYHIKMRFQAPRSIEVMKLTKAIVYLQILVMEQLSVAMATLIQPKPDLGVVYQNK